MMSEDGMICFDEKIKKTKSVVKPSIYIVIHPRKDCVMVLQQIAQVL